VFRTQADSGHRYDIHSSYPAALANVSLPEGEGKDCDAREAARAFASGREGIFGALVYVPEMAIPPLPVRTDERLLYPWGPVTGAWTGLTLRNAVAHGCRVMRIDWGYVWASSRPVLAPYAERVWRLRANAESRNEKDWAAWYKWLANSLTGKLAQRPEHESLDFIPAGDRCPALEFDAPIIKDTELGVWIAVPSVRVDACAYVQWAAYLTSYAHRELHTQLLHAKVPLYCDTDSVYAKNKLTRRIGPELGEWGYEGSLFGWRAPAPKVYRYVNDAGEETVKGKGYSGLDGPGFLALLAGAKWHTDRGVHGLRTAMRKGDGLFQRKNLSRALKATPGWVGGRELDSDGIGTRPTTLARYEARERAE
jgi:DNA polymerase family B